MEEKGSESVGEVCIGLGVAEREDREWGERSPQNKNVARQSHRYAYSANVQDKFTTVLPWFC